MFRQKTSGSYYEMGLAIGQKLRKHQLANSSFVFSDEEVAFGQECEKAVRIHASELLKELEGIAEGSNLDYEQLCALELTPRLDYACTVLAVAGNYTKDGRPILGRNHDWLLESSEKLTLCWTRPENKLASLGFTLPEDGQVGRFGGINEAGVALASVLASSVNPVPGVLNTIATRWILDNCETTAEAVDYLEKIPKVYGIYHLIIDESSHIAKVEAHPQKTKITHVEDGFAAISLLFDSPEMQPYNMLDGAAWLHEPRLAYLPAWFQQRKGSVDAGYTQEALSNHEHHMCDHEFDGQHHWGVSWSWIASIGSRKVLVAPGPPCETKYEEFAF
ncbi:MAG: C45 family autoproteolytic acyltransferase/hydrolase [Candidatus Hodarchaeota archaeon]